MSLTDAWGTLTSGISALMKEPKNLLPLQLWEATKKGTLMEREVRTLQTRELRALGPWDGFSASSTEKKKAVSGCSTQTVVSLPEPPADLRYLAKTWPHYTATP